MPALASLDATILDTWRSTQSILRCSEQAQSVEEINVDTALPADLVAVLRSLIAILFVPVAPVQCRLAAAACRGVGCSSQQAVVAVVAVSAITG